MGDDVEVQVWGEDSKRKLILDLMEALFGTLEVEFDRRTDDKMVIEVDGSAERMLKDFIVMRNQLRHH